MINLVKDIFKFLLKTIAMISMALFIGLPSIFGLAYVYDQYYLHKFSHDMDKVFYITNNGYFLVVLVLLLFLIYFIKLYIKNKIMPIEDKVINDKNPIEVSIVKFDNYIRTHKGKAAIWCVAVILALFIFSLSNYNIFYEDKFIMHRAFRWEREYTLDDVQSYTVEMAGLFNRMGYSMKLHMKDGRYIELFGAVEIVTDAFEEKYSTYGYKTYLDQKLKKLRKEKQIYDKEDIIKDSENMAEPYRSQIQSLVNE